MTRVPTNRFAAALRLCRGCGCDDDHACITDAGPCAWVLLDIDTPTGICSACAEICDFDPYELASVGRDPRDGIPLALKQPALLRA